LAPAVAASALAVPHSRIRELAEIASRKRIAVFERSYKTFQPVIAIPGDETVLLDRDNRILIL
jgi:hypothetical protein